MRAMTKAMFGTFVVILVTASSLCAIASDGRIPIGTMPYTINSPGSYYLTGDLVASGGSVITISSAGVALDLNGHYVWQGSSSAYCISSSGYSDIRVFNGLLVGGSAGIYFYNVPVGVVTIDHITARGGQAGIDLQGYSAGGSSLYPTAQITNNSVTLAAGATADCIHVQYVQGGRISLNTIVGGTSAISGGIGISSYAGNNLIISENAISNTAFGINLTGTGNRVFRNTCVGNNTGIEASSATNLDVSENDASNNVYGIVFAPGTGCVYRNNLAQGNTTGNYTPGSATNGGGNF